MTQFVIDLLDSSGNALGSGPLQNVISVSVTEKLDEAGDVSFVVPATDARVATLIDSAARFRVRFSSGAVRYGIIDQDAIDVTADTPTRTVTGADMLRELAHYSMGWWCFYDDKDLNTVVLPQLVADTPWSLGTVDASLGTLYYRFDGDSRLAALLKIADTTGYHFRLGTTDRTFDFGAFGTASAFRFTNVDHALVSQDNSTAFRIIGNLQITSDRAPVVNRIIPWGAGNDGGDTNRAKVSLFHLTPGDSRWTNIKAKPGVRGVSHTINSISEIGGHHYEMDSTAGYYELPVNQVLWCYDPDDLTLGYGYDFVIRDVDPLGANTLTVRGSPTVPTEPTSFPAYLISNPQLYIQDDTAYAADPHEATIIFQDIALTDLGLDAFESSASQLYDRAYRYLQDHKVPQVSYAVSVFDCPDTLRVGDTVQIVYRGAVTRDGATVKWVDLNESFNVVNITRTFNSDGSTAATVEISNIARQTTDSASALSDSGTQTGAMAVTVGSPSVSSASGGGGGSGGAGDPLTFASPLVRTINNITLPLTTGYIFKGVASTATASAPEALTKTDDTNVTLTLGGGHATALVNAASLTLGWQGVLSPTRGGTGVNNGTNTLTISGNSTINGSLIRASLTQIHEVYCMGDSLTAYGYYPSSLDTLLGDGWQVINHGISGHLTSQMLSRFTADVITPGGAEYVVILGGIGDIVNGVSAATIESNLQAMYTAAHNAGIAVVAVTVLPWKGFVSWTAPLQAVTDAVNAWILATATNCDYKIDAYTALEDPGAADTLLAAYDSGDHVHLSVAGYNVLADEIYNGSTWTQKASNTDVYVSGTNLYIDQSLRTIDNVEFNNFKATGTLTVGQNTLAVTGTSTINGSLVGNMTGGGSVATTSGQTYTFPVVGGTVALLNAVNVFTAQQQVTVPTTTATGLILKTSDNNTTKKLLEIQNSAAGVLASISADGLISTAPSIAGSTAGTTAILSTLTVTQTASANFNNIALRGVLQTGTSTGITNNNTQTGVYSGVNILASHAGTFNNVIGMNATSFILSGASGAINNYYGVNVALSNTGANTVAFGNLYHFYIIAPALGGATVTNHYGLYIGNISGGGTSNYSIYTNAGLNRLGDQLSIVGSADRTQLTVTGYTTQTATVASIARADTAGTGVRQVLSLDFSGSGADNNGGSLPMLGRTTTTAAASIARWAWSLPTGTHASYKGRLSGYVYDVGGERQWLQVDTDGSVPTVWFLGRIQHPGTFAAIHCHDASTAQNVATGATYAKITAFTDNGFSANCTADAANDKITITKAGYYKVSGAVSFSDDTNNVTWFGSAFLNGTEQDQIHFTRKIGTAGDVGNAGMTGIIDVTTVPWDVDLRMRHDAGGTIAITVSYANINVEYVGET